MQRVSVQSHRERADVITGGGSRLPGTGHSRALAYPSVGALRNGLTAVGPHVGAGACVRFTAGGQLTLCGQHYLAVLLVGAVERGRCLLAAYCLAGESRVVLSIAGKVILDAAFVGMIFIAGFCEGIGVAGHVALRLIEFPCAVPWALGKRGRGSEC